MPKRFEYKIFKYREKDVGILEAFNNLGFEGWELVSTTIIADLTTAHFKRRRE